MKINKTGFLFSIFLLINGSLMAANPHTLKAHSNSTKPSMLSITDNLNGPTVQTTSDGTKIIDNKDGSSVQIHPDGSLFIINSDGSTIQKNPDGSQEIHIN